MGRCIREPSDNYETKEHDAMSAVTWKNFHKLTALRARTTSSSKIQHIPSELLNQRTWEEQKSQQPRFPFWSKTRNRKFEHEN